MTERRSTFQSLHIRNYRYFWTGSLVANVGTWMNRIAQDWLVLTILTDNSALALGVVTGLQFLPIPILSPLAGALADRFSKRRILQLTQAALMVNALILSLLVSLDLAQLWHVYVLALVQGAVQAFDSPARQSFVSEMVSEKNLPNAVGLNSMQFNSARLVGPGVAGLLIGWFGVAPALWINTVSFLAPIIALHLMRADELHPARAGGSGRGAVMEGVRYLLGRGDLLLIFLMVFTLGTFGLNFQVTNALMATEVFGLDADAYGLLGSVMAAGTLTGAVMAARRGYPRLGRLVLALLGFSVFTLLLTLATSYWVYAAVLVPTGFVAITTMTTANSRVQLTTEPEMRGRIMALYMVVFLGGTPIGAPLVGWIGELWGARATLLVGSVTTGLVGLFVGLVLLAKSEKYPPPLHFLEVTRERVRRSRRGRTGAAHPTTSVPRP